MESFSTRTQPPKEYFEAMRVLSINKGTKASFPGIQAVRDGFGMVMIILGVTGMDVYAGW
jgi:hypothetical protein